MTALATQAGTRELVHGGWARARINWGRIVVDCPAPGCLAALTLPPGWPVYDCWECPAVAAVAWPSNLADIASVLWLRPDPFTRNWDPGESLEQLVGENITAGVGIGRHGEHLPPGAGRVLAIVNGRIVGGHPALTGPIEDARQAIARLGIARALNPDGLEG